VVAWLSLRDDTYVAQTPSAAHPSARPDLAATALEELQRAVAERDAAAAGALGADGGAGTLLRDVVANAGALDVAGFTARYVDESGAVAADGRWSAAVDLTWRFAGYDPSAVHEEVPIEFSVVDGTARISGIGGAGRRSPLWLTGALHVSTGDGVLVLARDEASVERYARLARRAVTVVDRVVTGTHAPLVVEVPPSEPALDDALGAAAETYTGVAAVTASVDGSTRADAPVPVFVNPEVMNGLDTQGAQIVISHEATHAATDAALDGRRPIWLTEGFADYVALRDVRLPVTTTAGQIIAQVRKSGPPAHLPGRSDFDSHSASFGAEYEAAWLACRVVADRAGERALVDLYDRVGAGEDLDRVLRDLLGVGTRGLTRLWQERLSHLAA
jgi:hypothetical protein